jgi:hypothetical protein
LEAEAVMWANARGWWRTRTWKDGNQADGARGHVLAEQRLAADCLQPTLRCGFRQQLKAGVLPDASRPGERGS